MLDAEFLSIRYSGVLMSPRTHIYFRRWSDRTRRSSLTNFLLPYAIHHTFLLLYGLTLTNAPTPTPTPTTTPMPTPTPHKHHHQHQHQHHHCRQQALTGRKAALPGAPLTDRDLLDLFHQQHHRNAPHPCYRKPRFEMTLFARQ